MGLWTPSIFAEDEKKPSWLPKFRIVNPPRPEISTSTKFHAVDPQIIQKLIDLLDERNLGQSIPVSENPLLEELNTYLTPEGFKLKTRYSSLGTTLSESLGWEEIKDIRVISEQNLKERLTTVARWDSQPNVRSIALIALALLHDKNDILYFREAFNSRNIGIRFATVEALEAWGKTSGFELLRERITKDDSYLIRIFAAGVLAKYGNPDGLNALREYIQHKDWFIRAYAAKNLGETGDHKDYDLLINRISRESGAVSNEFVRTELAIAALKLFPIKKAWERAERERKKREKKKKELTPSQIAKLNKKNKPVESVFEMDPLIVTAPRLKIKGLVDSRINFELHKMLRDSQDLRITQDMVNQSVVYNDMNELVTPNGISLKARYTVLGFLLTEGLAGTNDFQLQDKLIKLARSGNNPDVRSYALIALAYSRDRTHMGLFQEALQRENPADRFAAVEALSIWGYPDAESILVGVSKLDASPIVRAYASQALWRAGNFIGKDYILRLLDDQEWLIRAFAMRYMGELGSGEDYGKILSYFGRQQEDIVMAEMCSTLLRLYAKKVEEEE